MQTRHKLVFLSIKRAKEAALISTASSGHALLFRSDRRRPGRVHPFDSDSVLSDFWRQLPVASAPVAQPPRHLSADPAGHPFLWGALGSDHDCFPPRSPLDKNPPVESDAALALFLRERGRTTRVALPLWLGSVMASLCPGWQSTGQIPEHYGHLAGYWVPAVEVTAVSCSADASNHVEACGCGAGAPCGICNADESPEAG